MPKFDLLHRAQAFIYVLRFKTQDITHKAHTRYTHFCLACESFPDIKIGKDWPRNELVFFPRQCSPTHLSAAESSRHRATLWWCPWQLKIMQTQLRPTYLMWLFYRTCWVSLVDRHRVILKHLKNILQVYCETVTENRVRRKTTKTLKKFSFFETSLVDPAKS